MASLQERNGTYRFIFRHHDKQHFVAIGKVTRQEAEAKAAQVEYLLLRLKQKLLELPPGVGIVKLVRFDGKPSVRGEDVARPVVKGLTLGVLRDRSLAARSGGREESTIKTGRIHFKHLVATLGEKFLVAYQRRTDGKASHSGIDQT